MKLENSEYEFEYEEELTTYLDQKGKEAFDETDILKITLWKVARYPHIDNDLLQELNKIAFIKDLSNEEDRKLTVEVLEKLLSPECKGVRLPMASTYLRFRNPNVFQIIDRHVWHQVYKHQKGKEEYIEKKEIKDRIEDYLQYLIDLRALAQKEGLRFFDADRYYYLKDKEAGHIIYPPKQK